MVSVPPSVLQCPGGVPPVNLQCAGGVSPTMALVAGNTANEPKWNSVSTGTYNNRIRNGRTGARRLDLPIVSDGALPVDLIRRPSLTTLDSQVVLDQRYFKMASLRILLSDRADEITGLQTVTNNDPIDLARLARDAGYRGDPNGTGAVNWANGIPLAQAGSLRRGRGQRQGVPIAGRNADRRRVSEDRASGQERGMDRRHRGDPEPGVHGPEPRQRVRLEHRRQPVLHECERRSQPERGHPAAARPGQSCDGSRRHVEDSGHRRKRGGVRPHQPAGCRRRVVRHRDELHPALALRRPRRSAARRPRWRRGQPDVGRRHALRRTRREQPAALARHPRGHPGPDGLRRLLLRPGVATRISEPTPRRRPAPEQTASSTRRTTSAPTTGRPASWASKTSSTRRRRRVRRTASSTRGRTSMATASSICTAGRRGSTRPPARRTVSPGTRRGRPAPPPARPGPGRWATQPCSRPRFR